MGDGVHFLSVFWEDLLLVVAREDGKSEDGGVDWIGRSGLKTRYNVIVVGTENLDKCWRLE